MKTTKILDDATVGAAVEKVRLAAAALEAALGLRVLVPASGFMFTPGHECLTVRLEICTTGEGGVVMSTAAVAFRALAPMMGMTPDELGRQIYVDGDAWSLVGCSPVDSEKPLRVVDGAGKVKRMSVLDFRTAAGGSAADGVH